MQSLSEKVLATLYPKGYIACLLQRIRHYYSSLYQHQRHIQEYETVFLRIVEEHYHNDKLQHLMKILFSRTLFQQYPTQEESVRLCTLVNTFAMFCSDSTLDIENYYTLLTLAIPVLSANGTIDAKTIEETSLLLIEEHGELLTLPHKQLEELLTRYSISFPTMRSKHILLSINCIVKIAHTIATIYGYSDREEEELRNALCVLQSIYLYMCASFQEEELLHFLGKTKRDVESVVATIVRECCIDELCKHCGEDSPIIPKATMLLEYVPQAVYTKKNGIIPELFLVLHYSVSTCEEFFSLSIDDFCTVLEYSSLEQCSNLQALSIRLHQLNVIALLYKHNTEHTIASLKTITQQYLHIPSEHSDALASSVQQLNIQFPCIHLPIQTLLTYIQQYVTNANAIYALFNIKEHYINKEAALQQNMRFITSHLREETIDNTIVTTAPHVFSLDPKYFSILLNDDTQRIHTMTELYNKLHSLEMVLRPLHQEYSTLHKQTGVSINPYDCMPPNGTNTPFVSKTLYSNTSVQ